MRPILQPCTRAIPAFRRYLFRSAGTLSSSVLNDNLHHHIAKASGDPRASFVPVLEQWKQQGNQLHPSDLRNIIETLRNSDRCPQALKVSEWMIEKKACNLIPEDFVARLNLIDNVLGLEEAETFFESIPEDKRDDSLYTTMLSFYTRSEQTLDKAELIFLKMRELQFLSKPSPFSHMISLYNQLDKTDRVHRILNQMEENNVEPDNLTLNTKLRLHVAECFNITETEKLLAECDTNIGFTLDWRTSCDIAKAYLNNGFVFRAVGMLRRAEESVDPKSKKLAYESLLMLYGNAGKAEDVYRIWDMYKNLPDKNSEGYRLVISFSLKLRDLTTADKIVKEWVLGYNKFDVRIVSMMASAYCERGLTTNAEALMRVVMIQKCIIDMPNRYRLLLLFVCYHLFCDFHILLDFVSKGF